MSSTHLRPSPKSATTDQPRLLSLATAVPPYVLQQDAVAERAYLLFSKLGRSEVARLMPVFSNAGIRTRYSCVPLDWYLQPADWKSRNSLYIENAVTLLAQASLDCLAGAGLAPQDVDAVVTVSTTGITTPSLDAHLMQRIALRPDVERLPVFGLGCAGGVLGLSRAAALARARPGARVLLLVVELCALTFRPGDSSKSNIVAAALFGDGAAAALLTCDEECTGPGNDEAQSSQPAITASGEYTWPDSLDVMGWTVESDGLGVLFSRDIPQIVRRDLLPAADRFLEQQGLARDDLSGFAFHPGGAKVIEALEEAFAVAPGSMTRERAVLRDYGNMSAATVLFVLQRLLRERPRGRHLVSALGPGFSAGFLILDAGGSGLQGPVGAA